MKRSTLSGTSGVTWAGSIVTTRLTGMFSACSISENITAQYPPMECPIRMIGSGSVTIDRDRPLGDQAADREFVDICIDAGLLDLFGQTVHPAREDRTERTAKQVGATERLHRGLRRVRRGRHRLAASLDYARSRRICRAVWQADRKHRSEHDGRDFRIDHVLPARAVDTGRGSELGFINHARRL